MPRLTHIEQLFTTRAQAEAWFDSLWPLAWPYVWCLEDPDSGGWKVVALVGQRALDAAS